MITWRPASGADVDRYYGERPHASMRAIAILMDGEPAAIIGLAFDGARGLAFSEYKPQLEPHLKSMPVLRAIKAAQRMFAASRRPVFAVRESCNGLLERLGFASVPDNEEVYRWQQ